MVKMEKVFFVNSFAKLRKYARAVVLNHLWWKHNINSPDWAYSNLLIPLKLSEFTKSVMLRLWMVKMEKVFFVKSFEKLRKYVRAVGLNYLWLKNNVNSLDWAYSNLLILWKISEFTKSVILRYQNASLGWDEVRLYKRVLLSISWWNRLWTRKIPLLENFKND